MTDSVKLGKHFMALTDKYAKKVVITKTHGNQVTLSFIPQSPDLQHQLNYIRNSGQVRSDDWRGIEEGLLIMEVVGVLPVDELVGAIKSDMEELGYEVEVLPKAEGTSFADPDEKYLRMKPWKPKATTLGDVFREAQQKVNQGQESLVYPPAPETQEKLDELLNIQPPDNIYDIGKP